MKKKQTRYLQHTQRRYVSPQVSFEEEEAAAGLLNASPVTGEGTNTEDGGGDEDPERAKQSSFGLDEDIDYSIPE